MAEPRIASQRIIPLLELELALFPAKIIAFHVNNLRAAFHPATVAFRIRTFDDLLLLDAYLPAEEPHA